jgi:hypothetical protein
MRAAFLPEFCTIAKVGGHIHQIPRMTKELDSQQVHAIPALGSGCGFYLNGY